MPRAPSSRIVRGIATAVLALLAASSAPAAPRPSPDDPYISDALRQIHAQEAWNKTGGDCTKVIIAVIGNGVAIDHPDLKPNIMTVPGPGPAATKDDEHGWNFVDNTGDPRPVQIGHPWWHETYVAGIIGAVGNNGRGSSGVCEKARMLPVRKVFEDDSNPDAVRQAAAAIRYAIGVQRRVSAAEGRNVPMVINGSWVMDIGADHASPELRDAVLEAAHAGIALVFAAGNEHRSNDDPRYAVFPASWSTLSPNVISVGAVDEHDHLSSVSSFGRSVQIAAPAVGMISTMPDGGYVADLDGRKGFTSWATPFVTGAIALYWSQHPDAPFSAVREALLGSADHIPGLPVLDGNRLNVGRMLGGG